MAERPERSSSLDGELRFLLAVQRSRLAVMVLMGVVALAARGTGLVHVGLAGGAAALGLGIASTFVLMAIHRADARRGRESVWRLVWMPLDLFLVCWTIWLVRDGSPLWRDWTRHRKSRSTSVSLTGCSRWVSASGHDRILYDFPPEGDDDHDPRPVRRPVPAGGMFR